MSGAPTVFVVDDDPAVRAALDLLLRSAGLEVVTFESAQAFLERFDDATPGCLIADIRMPGLDGLALQARLNRAGALIPLVMLTGHADVAAAVRAMKGGALDFIEKPFQPDALLGAVHAALTRDAERRADAARERGARERLDALTPREREVATLVAAGKANKVIGLELGISERTVELHRGRAMHKLGARSVPELVRVLGDAGEPGPERR